MLEKLDIHMQKLKPGPYFSSYTQMNSKWIQDLNLRPKTLKILEENIRKTLEDTVMIIPF
jgi:uncharacterized protein with NRDE domain